jgi:hypothetical protein
VAVDKQKVQIQYSAPLLLLVVDWAQIKQTVMAVRAVRAAAVSPMAVLVIHLALLHPKEIMAVHQLVALAEQGEGQAQRVK